MGPFIAILVIGIVGALLIINAVKNAKTANIKRDILKDEETKKIKEENEKLQKELDQTKKKKQKIFKWLCILIAIVAVIVLFATW